MKTNLVLWSQNISNGKTEFGLKRNKSFIALQGEGCCCRLRPSELQACWEEGARGGWFAGGVGIGKYSLARFDRNCILLSASFIVFSQWY